MIVELGHFALVLALSLSFFAGILPLCGAQKNKMAWVNFAAPANLAISFLTTFAFVVLAQAFLTDDFSVAYVAQNSGKNLPAFYKFAAVWGGHEGSLLLWIVMLGWWSAVFVFGSANIPALFRARVLGVLALVSFGFLLFILATSNPFTRLLPMALDGRDLNPLLQDVGMIIHPPLLYMGYVGFSLAYAFALSALISGKINTEWAKNSRPWTLAAWIFLSLGIAVGSWWAYFELGWGGWWFWDPVENASFMPWLIGTALIHSLLVTEKRGSLKNWSVLLAICVFSLSLLGTFLVRSGVLTSVHAFATDPKRGVFILIFLSVVIGASLFLFALRAPKVGLGARFSFISRESFLLFGNILLVVACGTVLLGTLYPLLIDALAWGKISVGPPYFNAVFVPIVFPLFFLIGIAAWLRWKKSDGKPIAKKLTIPFVLSLICAATLLWFYEKFQATSFTALFLAFWIFLCAIAHIFQRLHKTKHLPVNFLGMHLAHLGVAVFVLGAAMVGTFEIEKNSVLTVENRVEIAGYSVIFKGISTKNGPNYTANVGEFLLEKNGKPLAMLYPEKRYYHSSAMPMSEASVDSTIFRDIYVALSEPAESDNPHSAWIVRVYYKPFISWLWLGALLMALGGFLAFLRLLKK